MAPNPSEQQGRPGVLFYLFAAVLFFGMLALGTPSAQALNPDNRYRDIFLILIGVLGLAGGIQWGRISKVRPHSRRTEDRILLATGVALPLYVLAQVIPLPSGLVSVLSPARGDLLRGLEPLFGMPAWASLSIVPSITFRHFFVICACAVIFFAAREFAVRARRGIWIVALPVFVGGAAQAALGLAQFLGGSAEPLRGTFVIRNHLAGFLEMAAPLALTFTLAGLNTGRGRHEHNEVNWIRVAGGAALTGGMLAVTLLTLSRGGFVGVLASLLVLAAFATGRGQPLWRRFLGVGAVVAFLVGVMFIATPLTLIARLGEHSSEGRVALWSEGISLVREYPLTGTGVGGFQSGFLKFKASEGQFIVDYAHNDYLQGLAELGGIGFIIVAGLIGSAVIRSARMAAGATGGGGWSSELGPSETRWAALGCLCSFVAILVHSAVDFNMYVPANTATMAWICGMAAGITPSQRVGRRSVEVDAGLRQNRERAE